MEEEWFVIFMATQLVIFLKVIEHTSTKLTGGDKKLELTKKDIGKYFTNENYIYFGDVKIDRKNLKYQKYSSFRGDCKAFKNLEEFKKGFDIESLTEGNKI